MEEKLLPALGDPSKGTAPAAPSERAIVKATVIALAVALVS